MIDEVFFAIILNEDMSFSYYSNRLYLTQYSNNEFIDMNEETEQEKKTRNNTQSIVL